MNTYLLMFYYTGGDNDNSGVHLEYAHNEKEALKNWIVGYIHSDMTSINDGLTDKKSFRDVYRYVFGYECGLQVECVGWLKGMWMHIRNKELIPYERRML